MKLKPSGQTLVLFALTLMLLTLLVLMTLSFGSKVKSRMEVQTVADATAYSNAVATARTMNAISVMNRVNVAHTVSTIGTLSLISWVTLFYQHARNAQTLWMYELLLFIAGAIVWCMPSPPSLCPGPACPSCISCKWGVLDTGVAMFLSMSMANNVRNKLLGDTVVFNQETRPRWLASQALFSNQNLMYTNLLAKLNTPTATFAQTYKAQGNMPGVSALPAPASLNKADLDTALKPTAAASDDQPYHAAQMVNASRGHLFMPARACINNTCGLAGKWAMKLSWPWVFLAAGWVFTDGAKSGAGYLNLSWADPMTSPPNGHPYGTWAHDWGDHTRVLLLKPFKDDCLGFGIVALAVGLIGLDTATSGGVGPNQHTGIHNVQHSYKTFPPFYDYNATGVMDKDDLYAVPKNMSMVSADPLVRNDPWESRGSSTAGALKFKLSGTASFDMVTEPGLATGGMQNAIGSGVTYYSRPDHYEEPPNLFAPYWRAGLTRMTVDRPQPGAARATYDAKLQAMFSASGQAEAAQTFQELVNAGYKGFE